MPRTPTEVLLRGLRVLGAGIREQWRVFAVAVLASALFGGMTVGSAFVMGAVSSRVILPAFATGHTTAGALAAAAAAILGVALLKIIGIVGRRLGAGVMQYRLQASYRRRVTRQYLRLPLSWHQQHPTGTLLSNANADVEATWYPIAPLPFACGALLMLVITAVALLLTDPVLALVGFVVFPAVFTVNFAYTRRMSPRMTHAQHLRAELSGVAHESVDGALVVKTLGREDEETARFRGRSLELRDAMVAVGRVRGIFDPLMEALPTYGTLAVLLVGSLRLRSGDTSVGDLVSIAYLFTVLAMPVRAIGWVLGELPRSVVGWDRVQRVLQAGGSQPHGAVALPVSDEPARLTVDGVTFSYDSTATGAAATVTTTAAATGAAATGAPTTGAPTTGAPTTGAPTTGATSSEPAAPAERPAPPAPAAGGSAQTSATALRGVSFEVSPGRTIAVVGPTGSGKSTLATLLVRLVDPHSGAVLVDDTDLRELRRGGLAEHAAMVSQSTFLFDDTVRGNVTLGADVADEQVWAALRLAQAERFVRALPDGLDNRVGERGTTLSGGQRQRLALARALVRRPRLLILDDATSSVDPAVEAAILRGLRSAELGATVVVVAYRRATIALADEVVYIEQGSVVGRGPHNELVASAPGYARLVNAYREAAHERRSRHAAGVLASVRAGPVRGGDRAAGEHSEEGAA